MTNDAGEGTDRRELIELVGRHNTADAREVTCGVYLTPTGYEARAEYADGELLRSQWAMDTQGARIIANRWLQEFREP